MTDDLLATLDAENDALRRQITTLERALAEVRRSHEEHLKTHGALEAIFRVLPDIYFRVKWDGTILDYRAGRAADLYVPPEAFLGKRISDVLPPDVSASLTRAFQEAMTTRSRVHVDYALEMHGATEWFEARICPLDEQEIVAFIRKVTEQRRDKESLRGRAELDARAGERTAALEAENKSLRMFRELSDHFPDGIAITRADGTPVYANAACRALFGVDPADAGAGVDVLAHALGSEEGGGSALRPAEGGVLDEAVSFRRADGSIFEAQLTGFPLRDQAQAPPLSAYVVREITGEQRARRG